MWYFTWVLGLGFAVLLTIVSVLWSEFNEEQERGKRPADQSHESKR